MHEPCRDHAEHEAGGKASRTCLQRVIIRPMDNEGAVGDRPARTVLARTHPFPPSEARLVGDRCEAALTAEPFILLPRLCSALTTCVEGILLPLIAIHLVRQEPGGAWHRLVGEPLVPRRGQARGAVVGRDVLRNVVAI